MFTDKDWEGVQKIGKSVKERTALKVGRFGLGFVSVYHLTGSLSYIESSRTILNLFTE